MSQNFCLYHVLNLSFLNIFFYSCNRGHYCLSQLIIPSPVDSDCDHGFIARLMYRLSDFGKVCCIHYSSDADGRRFVLRSPPIGAAGAVLAG